MSANIITSANLKVTSAYSIIILLIILSVIPKIAYPDGITTDSMTIKTELRKLDTIEMTWDEKETKARQLINQSNEINYIEGTLHASYILATTYFFRQQYQKSFAMLDSMLIVLNSNHEKFSYGKNIEDKKARIYSFMGMIFDEVGDYGNAMEYYLKSLATVQFQGDKYEKAVLYKNLGMTNIATGNMERADEYFSLALAICDSINDSRTVFDIYNALQQHYADSARYDKALQYGLKLMGIARESSDNYSLALANNALGHIYLASGHPTLSEGYLEEALSISEKNNYEAITSQSMIGLASLRLSGGKAREAKEFSSKALSIAEKTDIISLKTQAAQSLASDYSALGDFKSALKYYRLYEEYKDEEYLKKNTRFVLEVQTRFEMDKVHRDKQLLEDQLIIERIQLSKRNNLLLASFIGVALLVVILLILIKRYQHVRSLNQQLYEKQQIIKDQEERLHREREQSLNLEIEHKNRELTSIAMALTQENEFKEHLILELEKLKVILGPVKKQEIKNVNAMISSIKQHISKDSWDEFRTYFENVYSTFYKNLDTSIPGLNQGEKKLCAMLKLGLSTKEISMLTYREVKSVESARNRLRKKMHLDPKTNLSLFLASF